MSWTVIEFTESKTVEAVPTAWIYNNTECFWPTMAKSKIINEIRNNVSPNTCWPLYKIRIFRDGTYDDYATARRKARVAEDTSDLNSEVESKRKIVKRKIFDSSSDSSEPEETNYSVLPKMPRLTLKNIENDNSHGDLHGSTMLDEYTPRQLPQSTSSGMSGHTPRQLAQSTSSAILQDVQANSNSHCCCKEVFKKVDVFSNDMTKRLSSFKANLFQIREDIHQALQNKSEYDTHKPVNINSLFHFPFKEEPKLEEFNRYLDDDNNFQNAIIHMKNLGGKDTYEFIKRCLSEVIHDSLAMNYAFDGTQEKKCFKTMKVNMLVETALYEQVKGSDRKCYEFAVRKWLRRAKERSKRKDNVRTEREGN